MNGSQKYFAVLFLKDLLTTGDKGFTEYANKKILKRLYLIASDPEEHRGLLKYSTSMTDDEAVNTFDAVLECFAKWESVLVGEFKNYSMKLQQMGRRPTQFNHYFRPPRPENMAGGYSSRGASPLPANNLQFQSNSRNVSPQPNLGGVQPQPVLSVSPSVPGRASNPHTNTQNLLRDMSPNFLNSHVNAPAAADGSFLPNSVASERMNLGMNHLAQQAQPATTQLGGMSPVPAGQSAGFRPNSLANVSPAPNTPYVPPETNNLQSSFQAALNPINLVQNVAAMKLTRTAITQDISDPTLTSFSSPKLRTLFATLDEQAKAVRVDPYWVAFIDGKIVPNQDLQKQTKAELGFYDDCAPFLRNPSEDINDKVGFLYDFSASMNKHFKQNVDLDAKIAAIVEGPVAKPAQPPSQPKQTSNLREPTAVNNQGLEFNTSADEFDAQIRLISQMNDQQMRIAESTPVRPNPTQISTSLGPSPAALPLKADRSQVVGDGDDARIRRMLEEKNREIEMLKSKIAESQATSRAEPASQFTTARNLRKYSFLNQGADTLKPRSVTPTADYNTGKYTRQGSDFVNKMYRDIEFNLNRKQLRSNYGLDN